MGGQDRSELRIRPPLTKQRRGLSRTAMLLRRPDAPTTDICLTTQYDHCALGVRTNKKTGQLSQHSFAVAAWDKPLGSASLGISCTWNKYLSTAAQMQLTGAPWGGAH